MTKFVWIRQSGNFYPQKWPKDGLSDARLYGRELLGCVAAEYRLKPDEAKCSIAVLAEKYPPPTAPTEIVNPWQELPPTKNIPAADAAG